MSGALRGGGRRHLGGARGPAPSWHPRRRGRPAARPGPARGHDPRRADARGVHRLLWRSSRERLTPRALDPGRRPPDVPFSRAFEPVNWSPALAPPGRTVIGLECYCRAEDGDPVWGLADERLAACVRRVPCAIPWAGSATPARPRLLEVVRLPRRLPRGRPRAGARRAGARPVARRPRGGARGAGGGGHRGDRGAASARARAVLSAGGPGPRCLGRWRRLAASGAANSRFDRDRSTASA